MTLSTDPVGTRPKSSTAKALPDSCRTRTALFAGDCGDEAATAEVDVLEECPVAGADEVAVVFLRSASVVSLAVE